MKCVSSLSDSFYYFLYSFAFISFAKIKPDTVSRKFTTPIFFLLREIAFALKRFKGVSIIRNGRLDSSFSSLNATNSEEWQLMV